jgi:hypothetical protein
MSDPVLEFMQHLASTKPQWQAEDAEFQVRIQGHRYLVISEVDAGRLEALREYVAGLENA